MYLIVPCLLYAAAFVIVVTQFSAVVETSTLRQSHTIFAAIIARLRYAGHPHPLCVGSADEASRRCSTSGGTRVAVISRATHRRTVAPARPALARNSSSIHDRLWVSRRSSGTAAESRTAWLRLPPRVRVRSGQGTQRAWRFRKLPRRVTEMYSKIPLLTRWRTVGTSVRSVPFIASRTSSNAEIPRWSDGKCRLATPSSADSKCLRRSVGVPSSRRGTSSVRVRRRPLAGRCRRVWRTRRRRCRFRGCRRRLRPVFGGVVRAEHLRVALAAGVLLRTTGGVAAGFREVLGRAAGERPRIDRYPVLGSLVLLEPGFESHEQRGLLGDRFGVRNPVVA